MDILKKMDQSNKFRSKLNEQRSSTPDFKLVESSNNERHEKYFEAFIKRLEDGNAQEAADYLNQMKNYIMMDMQRIDMSVSEMSTSAGAGPYNTPFAFSDRKKEKTKIKYPGVAESLDSKYESLIESYRQFALGDSKMTPKQKIKNTIREVSSRLKEVNQILQYTTKLKTESGVTKTEYGPAVEQALTKISENLIKMSQKVRSLGE